MGKDSGSKKGNPKIIKPTQADVDHLTPAAARGHEAGLKKIRDADWMGSNMSVGTDAIGNDASGDARAALGIKTVTGRKLLQRAHGVQGVEAENKVEYPSLEAQRAAEAAHVASFTKEEKQAAHDGFMEFLLDGHVRIHEIIPIQSILLAGGLQVATLYEKKPEGGLNKTKLYNLSAAVNLRALELLNPEYGEDDVPELTGNPETSALDFNQHRQTRFSLGTFSSPEQASAHLHKLDQYLMHVLAEKPVNGHILKMANHMPIVEETDTATNELTGTQAYSEAFRISRLVEIFHSVNQGVGISFDNAVGKMVNAILSEIELPHQRASENDGGRRLTLKFDRDIGDYTFIDRGPDYPALMTQTIYSGARSDSNGKEVFSGDATGVSLQQYFLSRVVAAAKERDLYDPGRFELQNKTIRSVRQVPLEDTKGLGLLSPFGDGLFVTGPCVLQ